MQSVQTEELLFVLGSETNKLLGPFEGTLKPKGKPYVECVVGKRNRGKPLNKILAALDFTVTYNSVISHYGGSRRESGGELTVVSYCDVSGVLVVTTDLPVNKR